MRKAVMISLLLAVAVSHATTLPRLTLDTLLSNAAVVALVDIQAGEMVYVDGEGCGAKYRASVKEVIKGDIQKGADITFGPYSGRPIGKRFLAFLTKKERPFEPKNSTNSMAQAADADFEKRCAAVLPPLREMHGGFGTMEVSWTMKFDYRDAVLFPEEWVAPPGGTPRQKWAPGDNQIVSARSWVPVEDVVRYLQRKVKDDSGRRRQLPNTGLHPTAAAP